MGLQGVRNAGAVSPDRDAAGLRGAERLRAGQIAACNHDIQVIIGQKPRKAPAKHAIAAKDKDFHERPFRRQGGVLRSGGQCDIWGMRWNIGV